MATTTPNFGWAVPTSTDLVKDGAVAIETLGDSIDASLVDLKGGTTGQVLKKATNTDMDFVWSADSAGMTNPMTTTGDTIYSSSGSTPARLGIGSTGQVLTVAAGVPSWATPAGSSGPAFWASNGSNQSLASATWTKVNFTVERFDTDSCFASSRFTPTKSGYYQINAQIKIDNNGTCKAAFYKNGTSYDLMSDFRGNTTFSANGTTLMFLNGSTDYVEMYAYGDGSTRTVTGGSSAGDEVETNFSGVWIRS
jgi:hypothetical protein